MLKLAKQGDKTARENVINSNLRLVVTIAKKYPNSSVPLLDLIQEGNMGLIHSIEKFNCDSGYRFSTYATWWIRHNITRALTNQSKMIRIPAHMYDLSVKVEKAIHNIKQNNLSEVEPSPEDIAKEIGIEVEKVKEVLGMAKASGSLDIYVGDDDDTTIGELVADLTHKSPEDLAVFAMQKETLSKVLETLNEKEKQVLSLRFGLSDGKIKTLEEVGNILSVTKERIRQIEDKALRKMRQPTRRQILKDCIN